MSSLHDVLAKNASSFYITYFGYRTPSATTLVADAYDT
jgi:hypothetical protein